MPDQLRENVPPFLYGTAWKEERTEECVVQAVDTGFRGIDTANQRKHYNEEGVGEALQKIYATRGLEREDLFLQSKFTPVAGQDHRLPYDSEASRGDQVLQSFESTLNHLHTNYLDSYILHGPSSPVELTKSDWFTWEAIEKLYEHGQVKRIGVSNMSHGQLKTLVENSRVKPHFIQNRCFARLGWDRQVRDYCLDNDITYQGFSLLTANPEVFENPKFMEIVKEKNVTPPQLVFMFALKAKMLPLTGTTDPKHMQEDLACLDMMLEDSHFETIEGLVG